MRIEMKGIFKAIQEWWKQVGEYTYKTHAARDGNGEDFVVVEVYFPESDIWLYVKTFTYIEQLSAADYKYTENIANAHRFRNLDEAKEAAEVILAELKYLDKRNKVELL